MRKQKVAAIILNYNSSADCGKCIEFLEKQNYDLLSIIVIDNASTIQGEQERLQEICKDKKVRLVFNSVNNGFSAGNNVGLRLASEMKADWMLIINPDVELRDTNYISYVIQQIAKWSKAVVVGTDVVLPNGKKQNPMNELTELEECFSIFEPMLNKTRTKKNTASYETGYCNKIYGCCFFVKASFLEQIGFFDENVFMYCEEAILAKKVEQENFKELFIKEVTAYHEHYAEEKSGNSCKRLQQYFESRIYYINHYSNYSKFGKFIAVSQRKIERMLWKLFS